MDYSIIQKVLTDSRQSRQKGDWFKLITNSEALLEYLTPIIDWEVEQESLYRKFEADLANKKDDNGKYYSNSYCETQAKATDYYKEYRRAMLVRDQMYEIIQVSKKLAGSLDQEIKSQIK